MGQYQLLADLGVLVEPPQVSDDNPFSEAQFKTLKYHPSFPGRFGDQGQAKTFSIVLPLVQCRAPPWRHLMLTPEQVHFGNAAHCRQEIRAPRHGPLIPNASSEGAEAQTAPGGRQDIAL